MPMTFAKQAAVLLAVSRSVPEEEAILLTLRAAHLSAHSGEVAFPGGKWEPGDPNLCYTALREAQEEVGLKPDDVELLGQLPPSYTRAGIQVTPFVGRIHAGYPIVPNPDELAEWFWMPLSLLKADQRVRTDIFHYHDREAWAPVYEYAGFTIWGFTARVLLDFLRDHYGINLGRAHPHAPEVLFRKC